MNDDYIYRTPSIYDSQAPGNGLFASIYIFYPLVFIFVFIGIFGLHESPLYNERIWGLGHQKEFTILYAFLSLIVFRNLVIYLFFWHLVDIVNDFRKIITRIALADCGLFSLSYLLLFFVVRSLLEKIIILMLLAGNYYYYIQIKKFLNGQRSLKIQWIMTANTVVALTMLVLIFPLF